MARTTVTDFLVRLGSDDLIDSVALIGHEAEAAIEVPLDIDVHAMLDSRAHTDDLVRELQLTLLNSAYRVTTSAANDSVVRLARRLDAANDEFHEARRQIYNQTLSQARSCSDHTPPTPARQRRGSSAEVAEALDEADSLTSAGAIIEQLTPST